MNREIKFRGRKNSTKEWIYGSLISDKKGGYAIVQITDSPISNGVVSGWCFGIEKGTEGQYTGLKDKNGVEIYEGDILYCHEYDGSDCVNKIVQTFKNAVVGFYSGNFYYYPKGNMNQPHQLLMYAYKSEVIGNIHENPELLHQPKVN